MAEKADPPIFSRTMQERLNIDSDGEKIECIDTDGNPKIEGASKEEDREETEENEGASEGYGPAASSNSDEGDNADEEGSGSYDEDKDENYEYKLNCEINGFRAKLRELLINAWGEEGAATAPNPGNMLLGDIREAIIDLDSKHGKLMDEQPSDAAVDMQLFLQQHSILNQVLSCLKDS
ncbi:hypothetical protein C5167_022164 [Papaver somniferum]|uniref:Uncharacterized protein n=1 Tax=Papaver somniferum TaxID=3469 RepID=A0A4Y7JKV1_PAPSO|nr:hypothetical protein C5167_022164 [Papaver somniferum]